MTAPLEAERVVLRHPGAEYDAVRDVSLRIEPGEILALVGPNGSGKSTLLAGFGREMRPRSGCIRLGQRSLWAHSRRDLARVVARLPQDPVAAEGLRVEELVASGRYVHQGPLRGPGPDDRRAVRDAIAALELLDHRRRPLDRLSGGERRRAWIAMVLAQEVDTLLLDEPTAALDVRHQYELLAQLALLNQERGVTLALALHDLEQAASLAHRMAVMHRGRVYDVGPPAAILRPDMLRDVFGVDAVVGEQDGQLTIRVVGPADPIRSL